MPYIKSAITQWEIRNIEDAKGLIETFILIMFSDTDTFIYLIRLIPQFINYPDGLEFINFLIIYVQVVAFARESHMKITLPVLFLFQHKHLFNLSSVRFNNFIPQRRRKESGHYTFQLLFENTIFWQYLKTPNLGSLGRQFQ